MRTQPSYESGVQVLLRALDGRIFGDEGLYQYANVATPSEIATSGDVDGSTHTLALAKCSLENLTHTLNAAAERRERHRDA